MNEPIVIADAHEVEQMSSDQLAALQHFAGVAKKRFKKEFGTVDPELVTLDTLGDFIRFQRKYVYKHSLRQFAHFLSIPHNNLARYERGDLPGLRNLKKICEKFAIRPCLLLGDDCRKKKESKDATD